MHWRVIRDAAELSYFRGSVCAGGRGGDVKKGPRPRQGLGALGVLGEGSCLSFFG